MWRLTIEQVTKKEYGGKEYDSPERVVFESEDVEDLLVAVPRLSALAQVGTVSYVIEKVVDK